MTSRFQSLGLNADINLYAIFFIEIAGTRLRELVVQKGFMKLKNFFFVVSCIGTRMEKVKEGISLPYLIFISYF